MHISAYHVHGDLKFSYIYQKCLKIGLHFLRDLYATSQTAIPLKMQFGNVFRPYSL